MNTPKICPQCGTRFEGRPNKIFCTERCKVTAFHERRVQADTLSFGSCGTPVVHTEAAARLQSQQAENQERQRQLEAQQRAQQISYERQRSENATVLQRLETVLALVRQSKPTEPIAEVKGVVTVSTPSRAIVPMLMEDEKTISSVPETVSESESSGSGLKMLLGTVGAIWLISKL